MATFVYIDETGTSSLVDENSPILTVVAALVDETEVQPLARSLHSVAMRSLGWYPAGFEFHGYEVFHGDGWWGPVGPYERIEAYGSALALLEQHGVDIAYASIDKPKLAARRQDLDSPYLLALQFVCEKIHRFAPDSLKVLVADESKEHELSAVELVADLQTWGTGIVPGQPLHSIIDSLHFVRSDASPGVQVADLVAYIIHRERRASEVHPDAARAVGEFRQLIRDATVTWRETWPS